MPEVFLLCEYASLNGGERSMLAALDGMRANGWSPVVLAPPHGALADALASRGVESLPFECRTPDGKRLAQSELRRQLSRIVQHRRPSLFHANSLAMSRLSGPVMQDRNLPSLGHLRDIVRLSRQAAADLKCHKRLLAVSAATRDYHIGGGLPPELIHVVYNGVDLDEFQPRNATGRLHRELGLPQDAKLVGAIGQIGLRKAQDVLLHAAIQIANRRPNVYYIVIGLRHSEKSESREFELHLHETAEKQLHGKVFFLGRRDDVNLLLNELDILVHPARQEPLGRVLLEAAASGIAVVATQVGGTREIFPPEANAATLIPPDNPQALAQAVEFLLDHPVERQQMAQNARRRAERQFDIRLRIGDLMRHYRQLHEGG